MMVMAAKQAVCLRCFSSSPLTTAWYFAKLQLMALL